MADEEFNTISDTITDETRVVEPAVSDDEIVLRETLEKTAPELSLNVSAEEVEVSAAKLEASQNEQEVKPDMPLKPQIEAMLFITNHPLLVAEIAEQLSADNDDVEDALMDLMNDYRFRDDSSLEIDDADGYLLQVREEYQHISNQMMPMELSAGALQTLSAVAIKAPLLQSELVEMRGSSVYDHIPELLAKKLITKNRSGRSYRLNITSNFYEYFKLRGDKKELEILMALMGDKKPKSAFVSRDANGMPIEEAVFETDKGDEKDEPPEDIFYDASSQVETEAAELS